MDKANLATLPQVSKIELESAKNENDAWKYSFVNTVRIAGIDTVSAKAIKILPQQAAALSGRSISIKSIAILRKSDVE